jgi:hypothetical protein
VTFPGIMLASVLHTFREACAKLGHPAGALCEG